MKRVTTISNPEPVERRALVDVLARAFLDNPMNLRIHPGSPEARERANRAGLMAPVVDSARETRQRVISQGGRVLGGYVAAAPGSLPLPRPSVWRQIGCLYHQGYRGLSAWAEVNRVLTDFSPSESHWYLVVFGVDPDWQRRGLGSRLLEDLVSAVASLDPKPIRLESDRPESVAFYRAHGFEEVAEEQALGVPCWRMESS